MSLQDMEEITKKSMIMRVTTDVSQMQNTL